MIPGGLDLTTSRQWVLAHLAEAADAGEGETA